MFKLILSFLIIVIFFMSLSKKRLKDSKKDIVYIAKGSKKYHKEDCSFIYERGEAIERQTAVNKGFLPCKTCKPDEATE